MRLSRLVLLLSFVAALSAVDPAAAADPNAKGSLTVNGKTVALPYAYAYREPEQIKLTFSDVPLTLQELVNFNGGEPLRRINAGSLHAVRVSVITSGDKGQLELTSSEVFHAGFTHGPVSASITGKDRLTLSAADEKHIAGRIGTNGLVKHDQAFLAKEKVQYDVTFDAKISPWEDVQAIIYAR